MNLKQKLNRMISSNLGGGRLPNEYQEVEYIESDGQQYIDSGTLLGFDYGFDVKFYNKSRVASSSFGVIFGASSGGTTRIYELTSWQGLMRWGTWSGTGNRMRQYAVQECSIHNGVFTDCDGNETTLTKLSEDAPVSAYLFGSHWNKQFVYGGSGCRIYYLKFYYQNDLIRDFIPCYHKVSGEIGMYDPVTKTFYTNQGTGSFMKGPEV